MNRINKKFKELKKLKKKAFVTYITAGDPNLAVTKNLVLALDKAGVDIIELGIPFSDPMADGPTIQQASQRALKHKTNIDNILKLVKSVRSVSQVPLVFMTYYNPVYRYGVKRFVKKAKNTGVDGVIIPDLPPEEADEIIKVGNQADFLPIFLLTPTSSADRVKLIAKKSRGFIYYVSLTGVTGVKDRLPNGLISDVKKIKRISKKPVCVGFGVSNTRQVRIISRVADGVIIGSAIIKIIEENIGKKDLTKKVYNFVSKLVKAAKHN